MGRISIAVPSIPEQADALLRIVEQSTPLTIAVSRLEREIELLREYRTRLVADVVTGKLDVREAARHLPAEAEESEARLEVEDLADDADTPDITEEEVSA
jgi:type I restriction enzyme S subunit